VSPSHRHSHCVSLTVSSTVSPSPSLALCLPLTVSPAVSPSHRLSRCVSPGDAKSPHCPATTTARPQPTAQWTPVALRVLMHMASALPEGSAAAASLRRLLRAACGRLVGSAPADTQVGYISG
jgi:hypothetical protein